MSEVQFKVRDRRGNGRFWVDNAVLDHFGAELGPYGLAVYMALCRFADYDYQNCWPSQGTIAERTGMSRKQTTREVAQLVELGLVSIRRLKGNRLVYSLLDVDRALRGEPPEKLQEELETIEEELGTPSPKVETTSPINKTHRTQLLEQDSGPISNHPQPIKEKPSYAKRIAFEVEHHIGPDLHDNEHTRSNITRALRLWEGSELSEDEFVAKMLMARDVARRYRVRKRATDDAGREMKDVANRAPYFFKVLEDYLEDREKGPLAGRPAFQNMSKEEVKQRYLGGEFGHLVRS